MKRSFCLFLLFSFCVFNCAKAQKKTLLPVVSLSTLLDEMVSDQAGTLFPVPFYTSKLQTSYDRRSVIPGTPSWHANDDGSGFIRYEASNGRVEKVLFDEKGPGVITRIITTGKAAGANLRIYFDGEKEASISVPTYDIAKLPFEIPAALLLLHEHYNTTQGSSMYYPIPYAKSCKITVDDLNRGYYFHANYRAYAAGTKVKTFTVNDARAVQKKAEETSYKLLHPEDYKEDKSNVAATLPEGSSVKLELPKGERAIRTLNIGVGYLTQADYAPLMRGLIIKITFDGKQTVSAPLSDLSGAGMGAPKVDSWYLSANGEGQVTLRFIMPYQKSARVEIINMTKYQGHITMTANTSSWKWQPNTLYFHAAWRQENGLKTNAGLDYNMATIVGRGVFKGDVLSLYNHSKRWYGEGDEHIWVDNEKFPSHFGCGTEDYYNTTFAPIHVYHNPFGGAPREDDEASRGYNTFVRTRNLDVIPFKKKLQFEFELISWDGGLVDYSSTVYWYGDLNSMALHSSPDTDALYQLPPAIYTGDGKKD